MFCAFFRFATCFLLRILHFLCVFSFFPSSLFLYKHIQRYANGRGGRGKAYSCEGGEGGRPFFRFLPVSIFKHLNGCGVLLFART